MADGCDYRGSSNMSIRTLLKEVRTLEKCYRPDITDFFTSDDAFIIYTFLLLWPSYQTRHSFLRLINQDLSSSRLCWYTKGTWHISFSPVKHNIQKTSILAQKLVLLLRGKNIHYNSVKLEALLRLETGNWFLFCLFWFLPFYFIQ